MILDFRESLWLKTALGVTVTGAKEETKEQAREAYHENEIDHRTYVAVCLLIAEY